jgi:hypothetical protein
MVKENQNRYPELSTVLNGVIYDMIALQYIIKFSASAEQHDKDMYLVTIKFLFN